MNMKRILGLILAVIGGTSLIIRFVDLISVWVMENTFKAWCVFLVSLLTGTALIVWGYSGRGTHQINSSKKNYKINDAPKNDHTR